MHVKNSSGQITVTLRCLHPAYVLAGALRRFPASGKKSVDVEPESKSKGEYVWKVPGSVTFYKVDAVATALDKDSDGEEKVWFEVRAEQGGALMEAVTNTPNPERKLGRDVTAVDGVGVVKTGIKYRDFAVNVV